MFGDVTVDAQQGAQSTPGKQDEKFIPKQIDNAFPSGVPPLAEGHEPGLESPLSPMLLRESTLTPCSDT